MSIKSQFLASLEAGISTRGQQQTMYDALIMFFNGLIDENDLDTVYHWFNIEIVSISDDVEATAGDDVQLDVVAKGKELTYQWKVSTDDGDTYANCTEETATSDSLELANVTTSMNGYLYKVVITDASENTKTSDAIKLGVEEAPESKRALTKKKA